MSVLAQIPMLLPSWVRQLSTTVLVLAGLVGFPILAIVLNVLRQVCIPAMLGEFVLMTSTSPETRTRHLWSSTSFLGLDQRRTMDKIHMRSCSGIVIE